MPRSSRWLSGQSCDRKRYAARQDWDKIAKALRPIYTAVTEDAATERFLEFAETWGRQYPAIVRLWENAWAEFVPLLAFDAATHPQPFAWPPCSAPTPNHPCSTDYATSSLVPLQSPAVRDRVRRVLDVTAALNRTA